MSPFHVEVCVLLMVFRKNHNFLTGSDIFLIEAVKSVTSAAGFIATCYLVMV